MSNRKETVNKIYTKFLDTLLTDLGDEFKCTPGLYQVIRGVIQDNRDLLDIIPSDAMAHMENKLAASMPFKFHKSSKVPTVPQDRSED